MTNFNDLFPENLYHSYIVEGDPHLDVFNLRKFLEDRGEINEKSLDVLCEVHDSLTVTGSLLIKEWHSELGITNKKRICILGAKFINNEAERALLKILEEPADNTHFFLVVPNASLLLDTIRSRTHIVKTTTGNTPPEYNAKDFLEAIPQKRIEMITKMIERAKDNEGSGGLRYSAVNLINEIEKIIYQNFKVNKSNNRVIFVLNEIQKARQYLSVSGASVKMTLEHLALVI